MFVCPDCFSDAGLKKRIVAIRRDHPNNRCDFHGSKKGVAVVAVARIIDPVFRENYFGSYYDAYVDQYSLDNGEDLADTLFSLTGAEDDRVVETISSALMNEDHYRPQTGEEAYYSEDYHYHRDEQALAEHSLLWQSFTKSLLHSQRFFNPDALELIGKIFADIHQQRDAHSQGPVYIIQPGGEGSSFIRARLANDPAKRRAISEDLAMQLGPPPERLRMPGRLNASGIRAFYAGYDTETCIAELRPSVGETVVTAEFKITDEICVLDTTRFGSKPKSHDPFANDARKRAAQWLFMASFMNEIARPILPGDVHLDYVPTQAVAEYLSRHHRFTFSDKVRTIDAIIYGSAQHPGGRNIALLGSAAVVGNPDTAFDGSSTTSPGDDWLKWLPEWKPEEPRIVPVADSFREHQIQGVTFASAPLPVSPTLSDDRELGASLLKS